MSSHPFLLAIHMHFIRTAAGLAILGYASNLTAQTVTDYRIFYQQAYVQNSADTTTLAAFPPYRLTVEVTGSNLGNLNTTDSQDAAITNPSSDRSTFNAPPSGARIFNTNSYSSLNELNAAQAFGTYTLELGLQTAMLDINEDVFTNAPTLLGGTWITNKLQVTDGGYTFNFVTPVNTDSVRLYIYQQGGAFNTYSYVTGGSATSIFVPDADLELGLNYGATLHFYNIGDTDTAFDGADGTSGYMSTNEFGFTVVASAVPEPASAALLFSLAALVVASTRRQRMRRQSN
jgi:hypothetical protein